MKKLTIMSMILFAVSVIIFGIFFVRERFLKDRTGPVFQLESGTITASATAQPFLTSFAREPNTPAALVEWPLGKE